jgi:phosphoglycerate-specific signal transduction histidine kinase
MPEQYVTSDSRSGVQVALTGEFPSHQDDRIRIARTTNLFTRLISTILTTESDTLRRERFTWIEMQLEIADALVREDMQEVQRLLRELMAKMGVSQEQLDELARQIIDRLGGEGPAATPPDDA